MDHQGYLPRSPTARPSALMIQCYVKFFQNLASQLPISKPPERKKDKYPVLVLSFTLIRDRDFVTLGAEGE